MKKISVMILLGAIAIFAVGMASLRADKNGAGASSGGGFDLASALDGKLVAIDGEGRLAPFSFANGQTPKFYAVYFSAHWCGPCRQFTPDLVRFYDEKKKVHENFEVIFVSSDRNEDAMRGYMKEAGMAFPALKYSERNTTRAITKFAGPGIPCLVILDANGKVLAHSFDGEQYLGPGVPMQMLGKLLAGESST
jgi:nucleoredoxin